MYLCHFVFIFIYILFNYIYLGCFVKILIAGEWAGIVLGKGGETIVSLQKETDCTITLSKSDAFFPGKKKKYAIFQFV